MNECFNKSSCAKHAKCINVPGSYKCECNSGYFGDGKYCNGTMFVLKCLFTVIAILAMMFLKYCMDLCF